jgi:hypothetical protein
MSEQQQVQNRRDELARRIRGHRAVSIANDPTQSYRKSVRECFLNGGAGYNRLLGMGRAAKFVEVAA